MLSHPSSFTSNFSIKSISLLRVRDINPIPMISSIDNAKSGFNQWWTRCNHRSHGWTWRVTTTADKFMINLTINFKSYDHALKIMTFETWMFHFPFDIPMNCHPSLKQMRKNFDIPNIFKLETKQKRVTINQHSLNHPASQYIFINGTNNNQLQNQF